MSAAKQRCRTAKVRGVFRVSPKTLTVNTITPCRGGIRGRAARRSRGAALLRGLPGRADHALVVSLPRRLQSWQPSAYSAGHFVCAPMDARRTTLAASRTPDGRGPGYRPVTLPRSADRESLVTTPRRVPYLSDAVDAAGCVVRAEPLQQTVAILTCPFRHNLHSAVFQIEGESGEAADFQSVCPGEPAKPYLLYSAAYPCGEPYIFVHARTLTAQLLTGHVPAKGHGVQSRRNSLTRSGE